jgi:hypothetical protein
MFLLSLGGSPSYALKSRIFITPHISLVSDNKKSLPTIPKDSRQAKWGRRDFSPWLPLPQSASNRYPEGRKARERNQILSA